MKKIWFLMLMMCAVSVFTACSDDEGENEVVNPISNPSVPAEAEIGTEVLVRGTGFDASLARLSLKDANDVETTLTDLSFTASGVSFTIPMSLVAGDYTLFLTQNGVWELGKIKLLPATLPIIGLSFPKEAYIGQELTIAGNNFDAACKIYLETTDEEATRTELTITDRSNGVVCTIPATVTEGTYNLVLAQSGAEWVLGEITLEATRRLKSMLVEVDYSEMGGNVDTYSYYLAYNAQGQVESINADEEGTMPWYSLTYSNGQISIEPGITAEENLNEPYPFIFEVEDNQVIKHIDGSREYSWTYTEDKLTDIVRISNSKSLLALEWEKDNAVQIGDNTFTYDENQKVKGVDISKCLSFISTLDADIELFCAELLGISGAKSLNLLKTFSAEGLEHAMTCTLDEKGYLTSVSIEGNVEVYFFPITVNLVYE